MLMSTSFSDSFYFFAVYEGLMLVQAQLHPCMSRLRQRCFEIAVHNIAYRDQDSCFAWYQSRDPEVDDDPTAPSISDRMLSIICVFFHC